MSHKRAASSQMHPKNRLRKLLTGIGFSKEEWEKHLTPVIEKMTPAQAEKAAGEIEAILAAARGATTSVASALRGARRGKSRGK